MSVTAEFSEQEAIARIAADYAKRGYEVMHSPRGQVLPDFLKGYCPDLLARSENDQVVIEVKRPGPRMEVPELTSLAKVISEHPGWRLEVVLSGPGKTNANGKLPSLAQIKKRLGPLKDLYESGQKEAAFLMLWSLLEAGTRARLEESGARRGGPISPVALAKDVISYGFVDQDAYSELIAAANARNALAHGLSFEKVSDDRFNLIYSTLRRLTDDLEQS